MIEAYPLQWPFGYERTKSPRRSKFRQTFGWSRDKVIRQIRMLGGTQPVISTNIPLKNDGFPYATYRTPDDKGVAVYFMYNKEQVTFACDKWDKIEDNLYAIALTIEAIRGMDRWGVSDMLKRAFTGFTALPPGKGDGQAHKPEEWYDVLEVQPDAHPDVIRNAFREKAKTTHPDLGGSHEEFIKLKNAYDKAMQQFN